MFYCTKPTCYEYELIQGKINSGSYWRANNPKRNDPLKSDYYESLFFRMEELVDNMTFYEVDTEELD